MIIYLSHKMYQSVNKINNIYNLNIIFKPKFYSQLINKIILEILNANDYM